MNPRGSKDSWGFMGKEQSEGCGWEITKRNLARYQGWRRGSLMHKLTST